MRAFRFQFFLDNNIVSVSVDLQGASASRGGGAEGASSNIEFAIASVVNSVRLVASRRDISNLQWSARATRRADRWSGVFGGREICGCMKTSDYAVYKSLSGGKGEGGVGRLMVNTILNFHFDYWHTSLTIYCYIDIKLTFLDPLHAR